jgi:hypothetical protein
MKNQLLLLPCFFLLTFVSFAQTAYLGLSHTKLLKVIKHDTAYQNIKDNRDPNGMHEVTCQSKLSGTLTVDIVYHFQNDTCAAIVFNYPNNNVLNYIIDSFDKKYKRDPTPKNEFRWVEQGTRKKVHVLEKKEGQFSTYSNYLD